MTKKYWLMKTEPDTFSIDDLYSRPKKTEHWDGVRNYQARNFMRDEMKKGDLVLLYHSSCKVPGVAGIAEVVKESYPDYTSWDKKSAYYDPKSTSEKPRWFMVDIKFKKKFETYLPLTELKGMKKLKDMVLLKKGSRLSIQPVTKEEFEHITRL
ncbi:EVE domain-containing protein [Halobacteriovorax sp. JY17]|uniref:EVE domain-containing protein n=1 Tax=Halobacteriovorax sp. JY17 TaxID=2014617 RepID=UPI000C3E54AE|nr:EVE domain-containing protein [Halobacteriovorax sp. JY17]PIK16059.1 MAG: EVE domain-containing protein [Halobacteriovorax sp. JY17]